MMEYEDAQNLAKLKRLAVVMRGTTCNQNFWYDVLKESRACHEKTGRSAV
jgi:hypothetical protein